MLYPKESESSDELLFACRTCTFQEPATVSCIYRNSLKEEIAETAGNVQDVADDPTVGNSAHDPSDSVMEDAWEGDGEGTAPDFCTLCGNEIRCPFCDQPTDASMVLEVDDPDAELNERGEDVIEAEKRERRLSGWTQ